jgi:protein O-mannosyl-transferase
MPSKTKVRQRKQEKRPVYGWLLPITGLLFLGCLAYWNSRDVPFVFDDLETIQRNSAIRTDFYFQPSNWLRTRSLLYLTFSVNYWLGGQNVFGYHLVNIALHILNALLVFAIAIRIFRNPATEETTTRLYAFLAAAFFLVHPVQTESVTYVSSRSELLSTLFYLFGFGIFVAMPEVRIGFVTALVVLVCLLVGFGGKETVITLPAIILLYDFLFLAKASPKNLFRRWKFYVPFVVLGAAGSYYLLRTQFVAFQAAEDYQTRLNYFFTQQRVISRYIQLIVFPRGLNFDYDFPLSDSLFEPSVFFGFSLNIALVILACWWIRRKPLVSFSILWFFIALLPTSSVIPIPDIAVEHRLYLPLAGVCLLFPYLLESLVALAAGSRQRKWVSGVAGVVIFFLTTGTILRNQLWRDEIRLFSDTRAKSPHKLRPYNDLIYAHMKRGQEREAISVAKLGIENVPEKRVGLMDTLGNLYLRLGQPAEAVTYFKSSNDDVISLGGSGSYLASSFNNLGVAYLALAKTLNQEPLKREDALRNARESFRRSLEYDSNTAVVDSLINASRALGEGELLEQQLRKKLQDTPNDYLTLYSLAALLSLEGRYTDSLVYFRNAEEIGSPTRIPSEVLYFNYAFALSKNGAIDEAIAKYLTVLQIDPIFSEAHYNVALLYIQKANYEAAIDHLSDVLRQEPKNVRANMQIAQIYAYERNLPLARQHLQQVLQVNPQHAEALSLLQKIGSS